MRSLRHLIFEESNQESCIQISIKVLDKVLEFVFNVLYKESINKDVYSNFVQKTYFEKFSLRLDQLHELILSQKAKENHFLYEIFQKLLESDTILINNERLLNPSIILQGLQQDATFVKLLQPPFLTIIHGDLHFDNILVNDRLAKNIKLKLIDPRGFQYKGYPPGIGDIAYDIGKLLHSANGYYDFIHSGYMIANINSIKNKQDRSSEMASLLKENWATVLHKGGGSGDVLISHKQVVQQWSWYVFDILSQHIKTWIEENGYLQQDPYFWLRAKFNEAMHFCTMPKFHLQEDIVRTISIQIRGVELLNQFYKDYNKGLFTS
jgi:thiamine kinase-like enzyme